MRLAWAQNWGVLPALMLALMSGCARDFIELDPMAGTAPSFSSPWVPRPSDLRDAVAGRSPSVPPPSPGEIQGSAAGLSLPQLLDIALQNSPVTRRTWAAARAAAAAAAGARAAYYPTLTLGPSITTEQALPQRGARPFEETILGPSLSLSYLLLDFGGRNAVAESARQSLLAANWQHNQQIQDLVLDVVSAYYAFVGTSALLQAAEESLAEAQTSFTATQARLQAGIGTVTDALQAQATLAQRQLEVVNQRGLLATSRGQLATVLGLPANTQFNVSPPTQEPILTPAEAVDPLIEVARPVTRPGGGLGNPAGQRSRRTQGRIGPTADLEPRWYGPAPVHYRE
jgi:outer membrane protein TolC